MIPAAKTVFFTLTETFFADDTKVIIHVHIIPHTSQTKRLVAPIHLQVK